MIGAVSEARTGKDCNRGACQQYSAYRLGGYAFEEIYTVSLRNRRTRPRIKFNA